MTVRTELIAVTDVEPIGGFTLRLRFNDGSERELNLESELWGPVFEPLKENPDLFLQVRVDGDLGTIVWPNGADMAPEFLHGSREPA